MSLVLLYEGGALGGNIIIIIILSFDVVYNGGSVVHTGCLFAKSLTNSCLDDNLCEP